MNRIFHFVFAVTLLIVSEGTLFAQCCSYTLVLEDSYGDGWNGAELEVFINDDLLGIFQAVNDLSSVSFEVCPEDEVELHYSSGNWENENEYSLFDSWGLVLFEDGPNPDSGWVYSNEADCDQSVSDGDTPCVAYEITAGECETADNSGMIDSGWNPWCANYQGEDVWFSLEVPTSGNIQISTANDGGISDSGLALWSSTSCTELSFIACDDDGGEGLYSTINAFDLFPGSTVYIQVFSYGADEEGTVELCVTDLGTVDLDFSEIPIVDINTYGVPIPDEPKIDGTLRIIYNGEGNLTAPTDSANIYYGNMGIEIRGASSSNYPQKPYGFETRTETGENNNVPILDMPAENDWVLLSNYNDKSFVRNTLAQQLFRDMGNYGPRMTHCEVLVNGSYKGIYIIGEKIKRDTNRVDIATLLTTDNSGDELTGGYIFKSDLGWGNEVWWSNYSPIDHPELNVRFVYHTPKPDSISDIQKDYIQSYVDSLETVLYSDYFADPDIGFRKYLDQKSFIDYFLLNEMTRNNDGFKKSRYYFKDKESNGGKLKAGPTWDFDWAWKNISECDVISGTAGEGFAHHINDCGPDNNSPGWYLRMLQDTAFANNLRCYYEYYRYDLGILDTTYLHGYIDSVASLLGNAQERHYQKWPTLGINVGAPEYGPIPDSFQGEIDYLKEWITLRIAWLDANIPGVCTDPIDGIGERDFSLLNVSPNPVEKGHEIKLQLGSGASHIDVYNSAGQLIHSENCYDEIRYLEMNESGLYIILVSYLHGGSKSAKVFVR